MYFKSKHSGNQIEEFLDNAIKATDEAVAATLDLDKIKRVILMLIDAGKKLNTANIAAELEREETYNKLLLANEDLFRRIDDALNNITAGTDTVGTDAIQDNAVTTRKIADRAVTYSKLDTYLQDLVDNFVKLYQEYIPTNVSSDNQLVTQYDLDAVKEGMGRYLTKNTSGEAFTNKTELDTATEYYYGVNKTTVKNYDYVTVLEDATHENATCRYTRSGGVWAYSYKINTDPFNDIQMAAVNSGIQRGDTSTGYVAGATAKQIVDNKSDLDKIKDTSLIITHSPDDIVVDLESGGEEGFRPIDTTGRLLPATDTNSGLMTPTQKVLIESLQSPELDISRNSDGATLTMTCDSPVFEDASVEIPKVDATNAGLMSSTMLTEHDDMKTLDLTNTSDANNVYLKAKTTLDTIVTSATLSEATTERAGVMTSKRVKEIEALKTSSFSYSQNDEGILVKESTTDMGDKNLVIKNATYTTNGLMSKEDKTSLDNLKTIDLEVSRTTTDVTFKIKTNDEVIEQEATLNVATQTIAGIISAEDKVKLDNALIKNEGGSVTKSVSFEDKVTVLAPTEDMEPATKKYVDDNGGKVKEVLIEGAKPEVGLKEPSNKRITIQVPTKTSHLINDGNSDTTNPYTLKSYVDGHDGIASVTASQVSDKVTMKVLTFATDDAKKEASVDIVGATTTNSGVMTSEQVKMLNNKQDDLNVIVADLNNLESDPQLNRYYQHSYNAQSVIGDTFIKGMIYRYKTVEIEGVATNQFVPIDGSGSGGSGVTSYNLLTNKPQINGIELAGNVTSASLNIPYNELKSDSIPMINGVKIMGQTKPDGSNIDGEYYGLVDKTEFDVLDAKVSGLQGAIVYIGDLKSDSTESDLLQSILTAYVVTTTGANPANGYLVKVHYTDASGGAFRGEYIYVSGSSVATGWKIFSESESVSPATYTSKGVVQIKQNGGIVISDGTIEASVKADNNLMFTNKTIPGDENVIRNCDTNIFSNGVILSALDDTATHNQIATAKAVYDTFMSSGAGDLSKKVDKAEYSESESGTNTGIYVHIGAQQATYPLLDAFGTNIDHKQIPSAKLVKDTCDNKVDKGTTNGKWVYLHDGATQLEYQLTETVAPTSSNLEIPTAAAAYANLSGKVDAKTSDGSWVYYHKKDDQGHLELVTTINSDSTDIQVPTAKAAFLNVDGKLDKQTTQTENRSINAYGVGQGKIISNNDFIYTHYGKDNQGHVEMNDFIRTILNFVYPIGAFYISTDSNNPKDILGFGTWTQVKGAIYGIGDQVTTVGEVAEQLPKLTFSGSPHGHGFNVGTFKTMEGEAKIWGGGIDTCSGVLTKSSATNSCGGSGATKNNLKFSGTPSYTQNPSVNNATAGGTISDAAGAMKSSGGHVMTKGYAAYIWQRTA